MISNTKWAVAVLAGGLLTAVHPLRAAPVPQPKGPPEPAWMAEFRKAYELKDREHVKRVPRPLPPERAEFYLTHFAKTIGTRQESASRRDFARSGDFFTM